LLSNKHDLGRRRSFPEHGLSGAPPQRTGPAIRCRRFQRSQGLFLHALAAGAAILRTVARRFTDMPQRQQEPNPISQPPDEHDDDLEMAEGEEFEDEEDVDDAETGADEDEEFGE
jgi:hypothetical protein